MTAINDPGYKRIFCMVHAEKLSYRVSDQALTSLQVLTQGKKGAAYILTSVIGFTSHTTLVKKCNIKISLVIFNT